jgi:hypothetical protein
MLELSMCMDNGVMVNWCHLPCDRVEVDELLGALIKRARHCVAASGQSSKSWTSFGFTLNQYCTSEGQAADSAIKPFQMIAQPELFTHVGEGKGRC